MARRGERRPRAPIGDPTDPAGFWVWMQRYLEWLQVHNYSARTARTREVYLAYFLAWCEPRAVGRPSEVTRPILERYQRYLYMYRKKDGKPLSFISQTGRLQAVRAYFRWLARQNVILSNPAADLDLPRMERRLPRVILSEREVEAVLAVPNISDPLGLRDRAILETMYSTGVRRFELVGLELHDVDFDRRTLMVRQGKGKKDRVLPIGERALAWIEKYLREARPLLMCGGATAGSAPLFLTHLGESLVPEYLTHRVREYVEAAELGKRGSCHLFRHSMATLMLENGADVRFVQEMLGHANLTTTQIYTHVSIRKLQEIHAATHPGARLRARTSATSEATDDAPATSGEAEQLLLSLAAEAADEDAEDDVTP